MSRPKRRKRINDKMMPRIVEEYSIRESNSDYTSQMCADVLNEEFGTNFTESAFRKRHTDWKRGFDAGVGSEATEKELARLAKVKVGLLKTRKLNTLMLSEVHSTLRIDGKIHLITDAILNVVKTGLTNVELPISIDPSLNKREVPVYVASDIHDYLVLTERDDHMAYNHEIVVKYLKRWADYVIKDVKMHKYPYMVLLDVGDPIEGDSLRASQLMTIAENIVRQSIGHANLMLSIYNYINSELSKCSWKPKAMIARISSSNHSQIRIHGVKRDELKENDMSLVINDKIYSMLKNNEKSIYHQKDGTGKNVFLGVSGETFTLNIEGIRVFVAHGQNHKIHKDTLNVITNLENKIIDYCILGHYHNHSELNTGSRGTLNKKLLTVPAVCPDTSFIRDTLKYSAVPSGIKFLFDAKYGLVSSSLINLVD